MDLTTREEGEIKQALKKKNQQKNTREVSGKKPVLGSTFMGSTTGGSLALSLAGDSSLAGGSYLTGERSLAGESALGGVVEANDESEVITTPS